MMGHARFDFLPRHARGEHCQRMAKVDHLIDASAKEIRMRAANPTLTAPCGHS